MQFRNSGDRHHHHHHHHYHHHHDHHHHRYDRHHDYYHHTMKRQRFHFYKHYISIMDEVRIPTPRFSSLVVLASCGIFSVETCCFEGYL